MVNRNDGQRLFPRSVGVLIFTLVVVMGCAPTTAGRHQDAAPGQSSIHRGRGYIVAYPESWRPVADGKLISDADFEVADFPPNASAPNGIIDVLVTPAQTSLEVTVDNFITRSQVTTRYRLLSRKATRIDGGSPGYILRQTGQIRAAGGGSVPMEETDVFAINGAGAIVDLRLICRVGSCDAYRPRLDRVVRSLGVR